MGWGSAVRKEAPIPFCPVVVVPRKVDWDKLVTIDFETYFDNDYTLKKMSTSEYIRDPRFKAHMVGIKVGRRKTKVITHKNIAVELSKIDWAQHDLLGHNIAFDGFILSHHYGVIPRFYYDTLSMARGLYSNDIDAGLDDVAQYLGRGSKTPDVLEKTRGVLNFLPALYKECSGYCANDVDLTFDIFCDMASLTPESEMRLIHMTMRMFCNPVLKIDVPRVQAELVKELQEKENMLMSIGTSNFPDKELKLAERSLPEYEKRLLKAKKIVGSSEKFADLLRVEGIEPPVKISPAWIAKRPAERDDNKKWSYAFAKDDAVFIELPGRIDEWASHLDRNNVKDIPKIIALQERVQALIDVRISVKSTTNITRAQRFLNAAANGCALPVGYAYARAHTYRFGGNNKMNMQNLKRGGELRSSILAPKGHQLVVVDSGQIEARVNGWLWDQDDLLDAFREADAGIGRDAYCRFGDIVYGREITKEDKMERFVGKVCLGPETIVYTNRGLKSIIEVRSNDLLWDGESWVKHDGLIYQGIKETLMHLGLCATPDHEILTAHGWLEWSEVLTDHSLFQSALSSATLPSKSGVITPPPTENLGVIGQSVTVRAGLSPWYMPVVSNLVERLAATLALKSPPPQNATGSTKTLWRMTSIVPGYLTGFLQRLAVVTIRETCRLNTMVGEAFRSAKSGLTIVPLSWYMCKPSSVGTFPRWRWTGPKRILATSRATFDLSPDLRTPKINGEWKTWNDGSQILRQTTQTYDLANAGANHRFTVFTSLGPVIVHNCVLGLGFQMGAEKFQGTLAKGALGGPPVFFELDKCKGIVNAYRRKNHKITSGWTKCTQIIEDMAEGRTGSWKCLHWEANRIWGPDGTSLKYPDLKKSRNEDKGWEEWTYDAKGQRKKIYGGLLCLGSNTSLLTLEGWKPIIDVVQSDLLWDGESWVTHDGLIYKGEKETIDFGGVHLTADHEILVNEVWVPAKDTTYDQATSSCARYYRTPVRENASGQTIRKRWSQNVLGNSVRLWDDQALNRIRVPTGRNTFMRLHNLANDLRVTYNSRTKQTPSLRSMARDSIKMYKPKPQSMGELRRTWNNSMPRVASVIRGVLGRCWSYIQGRVDPGQNRQRGFVHAGQLSVGVYSSTVLQSQGQCLPRHTRWRDDNVGSGAILQHRKNNLITSHQDRGSDGADVRQTEAVYDILNAGPNHRFTIRGADGQPFIVHNCENVVQWLARMIVTTQMLDIDRKRRVVMMTHDEVVAVTPTRSAEVCFREMMKAFRTAPSWCSDIPLNAEGGFASNYSK